MPSTYFVSRSPLQLCIILWSSCSIIPCMHLGFNHMFISSLYVILHNHATISSSSSNNMHSYFQQVRTWTSMRLGFLMVTRCINKMCTHTLLTLFQHFCSPISISKNGKAGTIKILIKYESWTQVLLRSILNF